MNSDPKSGLTARVERFPAWAGACVASIGLLVLIGWQCDLEMLKRLLPRMVSMNPLTALGFVLCGAAIFFSRERFSVPPLKTRAGKIFAALALVLATLKICDTLAHWHLGIDKILFHSKLDLEVSLNGGGPPSSLAPNSAINFIAASLALLLLESKPGVRNRVAQYLAILVLIVSWVAVIGYSYGTAALYVVQAYKPMALHSAIAGLLTGLGILCLRPDCGPMALFTGSGAGSSMTRRLLPVVVVAPGLLGLARVWGQRAGYYQTDSGAAMLVVSNTLVFGAVVWLGARRVNQIESERDRAARVVRDSERRFRSIWEYSVDGMRLTDEHGTILEVNDAFCQLAGMESTELAGRPVSAMYHPDENPPHHDASYRERFQTGKIDRNLERRIKFRSGKVVDLEFSNSFIQMENERPLLLAIFRDISDRRQAQEKLQEFADQLEKRNLELKDAMARVKTLHGLIPICAGCKKIRDDKGYWNQIEFFIRDHTDASFSHGLCPECTKIYFRGVKTPAEQAAEPR